VTAAEKRPPAQQRLTSIAIFLGILWGILLADLLLPVNFEQFGLIPRTLRGLLGILTMPLLHAGFGHLLANTVPLAILLLLLAGTQDRLWEILAELVAIGGLLVWLFGMPALHVGASGLIFSLITFLIVTGLLQRKILTLGVSLLVAFLYGSTLLAGVLPGVNRHVAWDAHLAGAVAGVLAAYGQQAANKSMAKNESGPVD